MLNPSQIRQRSIRIEAAIPLRSQRVSPLLCAFNHRADGFCAHAKPVDNGYAAGCLRAMGVHVAVNA